MRASAVAQNSKRSSDRCHQTWSHFKLSCGNLEERVRVRNFGRFKLSALETNQSLFLSDSRRTKLETCTIKNPLYKCSPQHAYGAQEIAMPWPDFIGYIQSLIEFDLKFPANAKLVTRIIAQDELLKKQAQYENSHLNLERLRQQTNLRFHQSNIRCFNAFLTHYSSVAQSYGSQTNQIISFNSW